ncbi:MULTISPECIES: DoxX family membrane protein [Actinomadura]|uniref:DoxX family membrane protein n=2 Tax=Actinomadura yumaensis TaxID=111807 RepID=A0ABW2CA37_9ACTN|nr:DoxX family membrane protein [Actinomadura sp. J1-007]MWK33681.1 DoxX family membrane protein [Actinomadura sp. J1-007]
MRPITTLARPFVAAPYIMTGLETLRDPRTRAEQVAPTVKPIADRVDWLPKDPETLVRIEGALSLGTGALLLTGKFRRLTTLLLAAQLVPSLATEHRYWTEDDPERRASERSHLLKNASLFGALLMVATEPRRSPRTAELRRQVHDAQVRAGAESRALRREAAVELRNARREAARQVRDARDLGGRKAAKGAAKGAAKAAKTARKVRTAKAIQASKPGLPGKGRKAGRAGKGPAKFGKAVKSGKLGGFGRSSRKSGFGKAKAKVAGAVGG